VSSRVLLPAPGAERQHTPRTSAALAEFFAGIPAAPADPADTVETADPATLDAWRTQAQPSSCIAMPECQIFVIRAILSPSNWRV
jgi:hypothetical protein